MITPMQHITLICRRDDAEDLLRELRSFAAMHLELVHRDNHQLEHLTDELKSMRQIIQKLEKIEDPEGEPDIESAEALVPHCQRLEQTAKKLEILEQQLIKEEKAWAPFGQIGYETLSALRQQGLTVAFYRAPASPIGLPEGTAWFTADPGFGVAVSMQPQDKVDTPALKMPVRTPARIAQLRHNLQRIREGVTSAFAAAATWLPALQQLETERSEELDFLKAHAGMGNEECLSWIEGFVPAEQLPELETAAKTWGAALISREPDAGDPTPTLLKQNAFVSWIQPVFQFLGVTPGYNEVDVGWSFLVFLCLFSGMIIGDAGYGLLLLITVGLLNLLKPATRGKFANLLYLMGGATLLWGLLTGNFFGIEGIPAVFPALSANADPKNIMNICFLMGASHLTLAHLWNLWRKRASLQALAEIGWIGSTWTMYAVTGQMVLGWDSLPTFIMPLFILSVCLIVLFMTPPAKFKEAWVDHMMLPLSFVNNFVDVVSYVRLYAVGMATFALASSFNTMILGGSAERGLLANGIMLIILILGHALNFILAGMGVMVHGIRLNTLEFASHIGLTWSGIPYKPFKKSGGSV
jgi:V/A-type H+-transporting ATPase subunit I